MSILSKLCLVFLIVFVLCVLLSITLPVIYYLCDYDISWTRKYYSYYSIVSSVVLSLTAIVGLGAAWYHFHKRTMQHNIDIFVSQYDAYESAVLSILSGSARDQEHLNILRGEIDNRWHILESLLEECSDIFGFSSSVKNKLMKVNQYVDKCDVVKRMDIANIRGLGRHLDSYKQSYIERSVLARIECFRKLSA